MVDVRTRRLSRELFVAAIGTNLVTMEPWVIDRLTRILEEEEAGPGDVVFEAGSAPEHFYFLRQGRLQLVDHGEIVETIDGPRPFGMLDALVQRPHTTSALAVTPVHILRVEMDAWLELLEDSFDVARAAVLALARSVAALEQERWVRSPPTPSSPPLEVAAGASLDVVERLLVLRHAYPLRGAGAQPLADLASLCDDVSFSAGQPLFARGATDRRVFVPVEGRVEATRDAPRVSWRGGPGQVVCGTAAFAEGRAAWEARAVTRVRALVFTLDDWSDVMEENFDMVRSTLASLASERLHLLGAA